VIVLVLVLVIGFLFELGGEKPSSWNESFADYNGQESRTRTATRTIGESGRAGARPLLNSDPETFHGLDHILRGHTQFSHHFSAGRAHTESIDADDFSI
jgi:hypothetical protein